MAWEELQIDMISMKHRLSVHYYWKNQSNALNWHIRFMWNVNILLLAYIYENDTNGAKRFWTRIWQDGLDYARRFSGFRGTEVEEYLSRLSCYYLVCFIRNGDNRPIEDRSGDVMTIGPYRPYGHGSNEQIQNDHLIDHWMNQLFPLFSEIKEMPVLTLRSVAMLLQNGLRWNVVIGGSKGEYFRNQFQRADGIARNHKEYAWLWKSMIIFRAICYGEKKHLCQIERVEKRSKQAVREQAIPGRHDVGLNLISVVIGKGIGAVIGILVSKGELWL